MFHKYSCLAENRRYAQKPFQIIPLFLRDIISTLQKFAETMMTENEITYQIRGAIYDVYKKLGPGLLESVYEEAMVYELNKRGLNVERQIDVPICYDGHLLKTGMRVDLLVEGKVIVELKSVQDMREVF